VLLTIGDPLEANARWKPDAPALIEGERVLGWKQVLERVARIRQAFVDVGIEHGDRVAVLDRTSADYVCAGYALAGLGAIIVPISVLLRSEEVAFILRDCEPRYVIVGQQYIDLLSASYARLPSIPGLTISRENAAAGAGDGPAAAGDWETWEKFIVRDPGRDGPVPRSWDDPHMILYTSGTTGQPKGAVLSHRRTATDAVAAIGAFRVARKDRFLCYQPMWHTAAWAYIQQYFTVGGSVVLMERFDGDEALRLLARWRCTSILAQPVILNRMWASAAFAEVDLSALGLVVYNSYDPANVGDLIASIREKFAARGARQLRLAGPYGLTEAGPFVTLLRSEDVAVAPESVGTPVPGVSVAILGDSGELVPPGHVGEICVRGSAIMNGYWRNDAASREALRGGWLHTGDLGRVGHNGFLYFVDRKKDMVRTGGENVYSKEVETLLNSHPAIAESAIVGAPDAEYGERVVAFVVTTSPGSLTKEAIQAYVRESLAGFKAPKEVHFLPELPKNGEGKINKGELRVQCGTQLSSRRCAPLTASARGHLARFIRST